MLNMCIVLSALLNTMCQPVLVKPETFSFLYIFFSYYVVLLSSCVCNLLKTEAAKKKNIKKNKQTATTTASSVCPPPSCMLFESAKACRKRRCGKHLHIFIHDGAAETSGSKQGREHLFNTGAVSSSLLSRAAKVPLSNEAGIMSSCLCL